MRRSQPQQPISAEVALSRASALCSRSEHAESDIAARLHDWGLDDEQATRVLDRLRAEGFVDNARFSVAFVRDRFRFNGWGRIKLAQQLRLKQLSKATIEQALAEIDEVEYHETLHRIFEAKFQSISNRRWPQAMAALMRFGASRGFESDLCREVARCVLARHISPHDDDVVAFDD